MRSGTTERLFHVLVRFCLVLLMLLSTGDKSIGMAQPPARPRIAQVTLTPDTIAAGETTRLEVELDSPAPAGGLVVGISHITNAGLTDTIVNMPTSLKFDEGIQRFPYTIRTQRKTDKVTDIVFVAFNGTDKKSARLIVN
jgi:hypothetical protein